MPLCGIISSECLGTLPGAWAKQCENVLEVNACEWLRDTAWAASARGPAADQKQTAFRPPCLVKTQSCGWPLTFPDSHLLFHSWVSADRGWMPPVPTIKKKKKKHQQVHTGGTLQAHVVSLARGDVLPTPGVWCWKRQQEPNLGTTSYKQKLRDCGLAKAKC